MKKVATALLSGILIMSMTGCIGGIKTPMSSSDSIGKNYETVMSEFSKAGFENITAVEVEDLTIDSDMNVGDVSEIEINKKTKFKAGARFGKKSDVIITYHTKVKAQAPIAVSECQEYDYKTLETMFKDAGFINVTSKEVFDLDPDDTDVEFNNVIKIEDLSSFEKDDKIPYDSEISIVCHKPFVKHKVSIHINFIKNLLFNKYDITFSIGNENMTLEHGKDADFNFSLKEGKYTLSFANVDSSDVKGEIELDLTSDVDVSYMILCYGDYVSVEEEYIDKKIPLADDEIKMVCDKWEYTGENYREVIKNLKSLGFTNIKEEPLYDIVWGITEEGSVENVKINGRDDYTLGTIFKKNSEIVVSYHLKEKKTETTTTPNADTQKKPETTTKNQTPSSLTINTCSELNDILFGNAQSYSDFASFARKYAGDTIEFNGSIDYAVNHKDYKTRFDILISSGDYDPSRQTGPTFKFENVNVINLSTNGDMLNVGDNVYVTAKIVKFDENTGIFYLEPISVRKR